MNENVDEKEWKNSAKFTLGWEDTVIHQFVKSVAGRISCMFLLPTFVLLG